MTSALSNRRAYIDWARGVAVLLMIEAHTTDAWTRAADKKSMLYRDATILGGFAAPMFLWLAGLAVVLAATRSAERTGSRAQAVEGDRPARPGDFHPRLSLPPPGLHRQPGQPPGDAVPRRHPQHHGPGDRHGGRGLGAGQDRGRPHRRVFGGGDRVRPADADRPRVAAGRAPPGVGAVVYASGGRAHGVHALAVGRVRLRGRRRRRAARDRARRAIRAARERRDGRRRCRAHRARASTRPGGRRSTPPRRSGPARRPGSRSASGS